MSNDALRSRMSELCYLVASKVESPAGVLSDLSVLTADGKPLGTVAGVVIEPAARRVRHYDVQSTGWFSRRHYLLEADQLVQLEGERKAVRLRATDEVREVRNLDPRALRPFSDDDLLAAMFSPHAAQM
jgi:sporulation protein YlmC with PRC-barrel domain